MWQRVSSLWRVGRLKEGRGVGECNGWGYGEKMPNGSGGVKTGASWLRVMIKYGKEG